METAANLNGIKSKRTSENASEEEIAWAEVELAKKIARVNFFVRIIVSKLG